jgi:hypothetical protein
MMEIGRALMYSFEDPDKIKKLLIGGLLRIVPIASWISDGYALVQTKNIYEGRELPLPEWSDMGKYFTKGLMQFIGTLIYMIPAILIMCCMYAPMIFAGSGSSSSSGNDTMGTIAMIATTCGGCLLLLYGLVLIVILPAVTTRYAITEQFNAFLQIGPGWQMVRSNMGSYVMAIVVVIIAGFVGSLLGSITCGLGYPFVGFWASLVGAYAFGNFAKTALAAPPQ